MKRLDLLNKIATPLLVVIMSLGLLTGCQSKNTKTSDKTSRTSFNAEDIKKKMEDNIALLVTDKTITQSQADKVLEVLSTSQMYSGQRNSQNGQPNKQTNNQAPSSGPNNQPNNGPKGSEGNNSNIQRANPLSKLVTDNVITQAQADIINEKVRGNFGRPKGN